MEKMRIDKWLWAARFFKTRALAVEELDKGRVQINGQAVKPAHDVKPGDVVQLIQARLPRTVTVMGLSMQRGPAPAAQLLYEESADSLARRAQMQEQMRLQPEPAHSLMQGRPTKRDRRELNRAWDQRWSASLDD
jgi:ribosome-associated heat shock protein Hsp15